MQLGTKQASLLATEKLTEVSVPLAHRMRPLTLRDVAGQSELTQSNSWFANLISEGRAISCIYWGHRVWEKQPLAW
jgi:putative ATPase